MKQKEFSLPMLRVSMRRRDMREGLLSNMKRITEYKKNGYNYTVIYRKGNLAVAQETRHGSCEVFYIQSHQGREINGKVIPAAEFVPSNNQWGALGWTLPNHESAMRKVEELTE
jgi:hypothetical protein